MGQSCWDSRKPPKAGVLRDITDPVEADTPIQGHNLEADHRHETPTA